MFITNKEIIRGWNKLERIIVRFVDMVLVDKLPMEALKDGFLYMALCNLSRQPLFVCRSP